MKTINVMMTSLYLVMYTAISAQVQVDKPIDLQGTSGNRKVTNLELPVNGTDAANKAYVDAAVAAGGTGASSVTMMASESPTGLTYYDAQVYCRDLVASGYTDWKYPSLYDFEKLIADGFSFLEPTSSNYFGMNPRLDSFNATGSSITVFRFSDKAWSTTSYGGSVRVRCVR